MPLNGDFNLFEDDDGSGWIVYNSDKNGHLCGACHIPPCDCGAETPVSRHFRPKSLNICPDRLGANIGKVEKNHVSAGFQMSVERLTADFTASGADAISCFMYLWYELLKTTICQDRLRTVIMCAKSHSKRWCFFRSDDGEQWLGGGTDRGSASDVQT